MLSSPKSAESETKQFPAGDPFFEESWDQEDLIDLREGDEAIRRDMDLFWESPNLPRLGNEFGERHCTESNATGSTLKRFNRSLLSEFEMLKRGESSDTQEQQNAKGNKEIRQEKWSRGARYGPSVSRTLFLTSLRVEMQGRGS